LLTTKIQLPIVGVKIDFSNYFFDKGV
jgi:hypothetical protein